jgi:hypothetical protein
MKIQLLKAMVLFGLSLTLNAQDKLTTSTTYETNDYIAWQKIRFYVSPKGYFISKDVDILKARLAHWDYWFMPNPYNNLFQREMQSLEEDFNALKVDLHVLQYEEKRRKRKSIISSITAVSFALAAGYIIGLKR